MISGDFRVERRQSVDLMRFVAAFGIVWAHMQAPLMVLGYVVLALFVVLTAFLSFRSAESRAFGPFMRGRALRVLVPWLVWCGLYLALAAFRDGDLARLWTVTDWRRLLVGPEIHLWFLPFVFLAAPLCHLATRLLVRPGAVKAAALVLSPCGLAAIWAHDHLAIDPPFIQWLSATVPLLYGILSAAAGRQGGWPAPLVFALAATLPAAFLWGSLLAPHLLSAALLFEAAWRWNIRSRLLPRLGRLSFGIYLIHPFFLLVWYRFAAGQAQWLGALAVFAASALAARAMLALPIRPRQVDESPSPRVRSGLEGGMMFPRAPIHPIRRQG